MHDEEFIVNTPKGDYAVSITHDFEEDEVKAPANKWWGREGAPITTFHPDEKPDCYEQKED